MPLILAILFYCHASYCYGSMLAHVATSYRRFAWVQKLTPNGVGRVADVLAWCAAIGIYFMAGGSL